MDDEVYAVGPVGIGTVSGTVGTSAVTGAGTAFLSQYKTGDVIRILGTGGAAYTVASVTDNTHLTISGTLSATYSGAAHHGLREAEDLVATQLPPRSTPTKGERVRTGSGVSVFRGYPTTEWTWEGVSVADFTALRTYLAGGALSAGCYVQTRDLDDVWAIWRAIVDIADAPDLRRSSSHYLPVTLTFTLIEEQ